MISLKDSSKFVPLKWQLNPTVCNLKKVMSLINLILVNQEFIENSKQTIQQEMTLGDLSDLLTNMCSQESIIKSNPKDKTEDSEESVSESKHEIIF
jgi:hypothetical protein